MSSSSAVVASTIGRATPSVWAVWGSSSAIINLCIGLAGLAKTAIFEAVGTISRSVCARTRQALDEAEPHGIGYTHEYNRNGGGCRFQDYGCLWADGDEQIGAESDQLRSQSRQVILGLGITIFDDQVLSIDPAAVSQAITPCDVVNGTNGENAKPTTCPLRPRTLWRNEQGRSSRCELPSLHCITSSSRTSSEASTSGSSKYMGSITRAKE